MLSPVSHARTPEQVAVYKVEPYVIAADVYGADPHVGCGGWTWYTGSAGWMFRVAVESILGLGIENGKTLTIQPCVPKDWPGFKIRYRIPGEKTRYEIEVVNPEGRTLEVASGQIDGDPVPIENGVARIPLSRDGAVHRVKLVLG
jgi:cyclic beta-1,2-glucan synthetase